MVWPPLRALAGTVAADAASTNNVSLYIVGGIAALATVLAAVFAMKGTFRTAETAREAALDAAVDKDRQALRDERDQIRSRLDAVVHERDQAREQLARLRLALLKKGLDPDNL